MMWLTTILRRSGGGGGGKTPARGNSLWGGLPSFAPVYLDELFHPFRSLGDSQHLEVQFNIPSQAKNLLERQKG